MKTERLNSLIKRQDLRRGELSFAWNVSKINKGTWESLKLIKAKNVPCND